MFSSRANFWFSHSLDQANAIARSLDRLRAKIKPAFLLGAFLGSFCNTAYSLTNEDFSNTGLIAASPAQFENNVSNNNSTAVVLPKGATIEKTADASALSTPTQAGDLIAYSIKVENIGLLSLTDVSLTDSIIADADLTLVSGDLNNDSILDADELWVYEGVYAITQNDLDTNGGGDADIDNSVSMTSKELPELSDQADVAIIQSPDFTVAKVVDKPTVAIPGSLGYEITVVNTGNLTLTGVSVTDTLPDGIVGVVSGPVNDVTTAGALDVGETWVFNANYTVSQTDIDNGSDLINLVEVVTNETGSVSKSDTATTTIETKPAFALSKVVDEVQLSEPATLNYQITIENTGNLTLNNISLVDQLPDGSAAVLTGPLTDTGSIGALDVGETWNYTAQYTVTQAEIDAGVNRVNEVTATTDETGATEQTASATTELSQAPSMAISKSVDQSVISAPGTLEYLITLNNTGNVSLNNIALSDNLPDGTPGLLTGPITDTGAADVLDVGETWQFTATFVADQDDIDRGVDLVNTVSALSRETGSTTHSDQAITTINSVPSFDVSKTVDIANATTPSLLSYEIEIVNTGNTSLSNVVVFDTLPDGLAGTLSGPSTDTGLVSQLDVGESWLFLGSYTLSQAEIDAGVARTNTVAVTTDQTGATPLSDTALTTITQTPDYELTKEVDLEAAKEPSVLTYTITATNTGNVSLTGFSITDTLPDGAPATLAGPVSDSGQAGVIDVGESWIWTSSYTVTQADIDMGTPLINQVEMQTVEAGTRTAEAQTIVSQEPEITITKATDATEFLAGNDVLNYVLTITNTGNTALSDIVVTTNGADSATVDCSPGVPTVLLPGEQFECLTVHTITAQDVAATEVRDQAFVTSLDLQGTTLSDQSEVLITPMTRIPPVATDNSVISPLSAVTVTLPGASDDTDTNGDLLLQSLSFVHPQAIDSDADGDMDSLTIEGEGIWQVDNTTGVVSFIPQSGFTGDPAPINYTVTDATGLVSNVATLTVDYPQTAPLAQDDFKLNPNTGSPDNPTMLNVIADNGNGMDTDPENDLNIQSIAFINEAATDTDEDGDADELNVEGEGVWQIDNGTGDVTFTPEAGFLSDPTPIGYTITDNTGLTSNVAIITVDYPQTAPLAVDDELLEQLLGLPITLATLANDSDPENNIDPTSVTIIDPDTGDAVTTLPIADEGVWTVDPITGSITFTPITGFVSDPIPIKYSVFDTTGYESNQATETITYEEPASLEGTVWLDANRNGEVDENEDRKAGWTLKVIDSAGNVVATTVTDSDGNYLITGLIPGIFTIEFYNPSGVFMDSITTDGPLVSGQSINLPLPIDPSGIVYDSISRLPVEGATLNLLNAAGDIIDDSCLNPGQQTQTTEADGLYAFDVYPGAHASCALIETYVLDIATLPDIYHQNFSSVIRAEGSAECGSATLGCSTTATFDSDTDETGCTVDSLPNTNACEIQPQATAPQLYEETRYYVEFTLTSGDQNVIFNHLPVDAKINDAEILLSKVTDQGEASAGGILQYTISAENTKDVTAFAVEIFDSPPAGFSFATDSAQLARMGEDELFGTSDDIVVALDVQSSNPLVFGPIDIESLETIKLTYLMRVGTGVIAGEYKNSAWAEGPIGIASNRVSASVQIIADPVLDQATLIGKVYDDRDSDGVQDPADATNVSLRSDYYGWSSLSLPELPGRRSASDNPLISAVVVNMPIINNNRFALVTGEGTRLTVEEDGTITEAHVGARARGLNAQDIRVCTARISGPATMSGDPIRLQNVSESGTFEIDSERKHTDVLQIVISNHGISERGIPGVRLATVTGLVIETDGYGRFNIPDLDAGSNGIGQNFILKIDAATLPEGSIFTTENPYVLRIVNSGLNKINFGVNTPQPSDDYYSIANLPCQIPSENGVSIVQVELGSVFFDTNDASVRKDQQGIVMDIISKLKQYGGGEIVIEANTDSRGSFEYNLELAERRAQSIERLLRDNLGAELMRDVTVVVGPAAQTELEE